MQVAERFEDAPHGLDLGVHITAREPPDQGGQPQAQQSARRCHKPCHVWRVARRGEHAGRERAPFGHVPREGGDHGIERVGEAGEATEGAERGHRLVRSRKSRAVSTALTSSGIAVGCVRNRSFRRRAIAVEKTVWSLVITWKG